MPRITITNHYPYCEAATGDTVHFEYDGRAFYVECWSTRHGSGVDIYDLDHRAAHPFTEGDRDEFDDQIGAFLTALGKAEDVHGVAKARQAALMEAMGAFNSRPDRSGG